jgi:integrative and conjugative element protein (TIGR02256 family)
LVKDAARTVRLRTLEAQYYRAVIRSAWGESHLDGNLGRLWSGGGCRDISLVMPHSRIVGHAATLAEQIRIQCHQPEAGITVWERDGNTGVVGAHHVPVQKERRMALDDFELFVDEGVIADMMAARAEQLPNETGGILLGYFDFNRKSVVVVDALRAPPDSVSSPVAFTRGTAGVREAVAEAGRRTAEVVGYIGEWHSHPTGCAANPSQDDMIQLVALALGMSEEGSPVVTMIVGDGGDVQALIGEVRQ